MRRSIREEILAEALRQFLAKGYASVSVRELIEPLKLSKGGFYHHYKSKESLFLAVVERVLSDWTASVASVVNAESASVRERMRNLFLSPLTRTGIHYGLLYEGLRIVGDVRPLTIKVVAELVHLCDELLVYGQKSGEVRDFLDNESWAFQIAATVEGGYLLATLGGIPNLEELLLRSFESTWRSIRAMDL
jgi:AcrR family transcriptional regulator